MDATIILFICIYPKPTSVCSSVTSPRTLAPSQGAYGGNSTESLQQPVFSESHPLAELSESDQPTNTEKLHQNDSTDARITTSATSTQSNTAVIGDSSSQETPDAGTDTVLAALLEPDNRKDEPSSNSNSDVPVKQIPIVSNSDVPEEPNPIIISPVIDITDDGSDPMNSIEKQQPIRRQSSHQLMSSTEVNNKPAAAVKRRSSVPASLVPTVTGLSQPSLETSALFAFPEGATGRGPYRPRGRPPNKPGSPVHDPNDAISRIVQKHIENIKEKTATIVETKDHVLKTMGSSAPGWFGKGCRINKRRKKSR